MSFDPDSVSDRLDLVPDDCDPDWNGKLFVVKACPKNSSFYALDEEGRVFHLSYSDEATFWSNSRKPVYYNFDDPETGQTWEDADIIGWTFHREDAEEASELFKKIG